MITAEELIKLGFEPCNTAYHKRRLGKSYAGEADYSQDMSEYCSIHVSTYPEQVEVHCEDGYSNYSSVTLHNCKTLEQIQQLINMF